MLHDYGVSLLTQTSHKMKLASHLQLHYLNRLISLTKQHMQVFVGHVHHA